MFFSCLYDPGSRCIKLKSDYCRPIDSCHIFKPNYKLCQFYLPWLFSSKCSKSMFGLLKSVHVHHMTDQDLSLGPSFIVSNITESDEILSVTFFTKMFLPSKHIRTFLHLTKYQCEFYSFSSKENETFLASYVRLQS